MEKLFPWAWEALEQADRRLRNHRPRPLSLAPSKETITPFVTLGEQQIHQGLDSSLLNTAITGFCSIVDSQIYHFPDNIFWDFDYLFNEIFTFRDVNKCANYCKTIGELQKGYGIHSKIRFQYMHDFTFGFDWARWVAKDPGARKKVKPLDEKFLSYLDQRLTELLDLIACNDKKYPELKNEAPRNPYQFARTPEAEKKLHLALAAKGLIPVEAWKSKPESKWDQDYTGIREKLSGELEL